MKADGLRSVRSVDQEVRLTVSGFARVIERAGEFDFKPHPHMLRHACGFALASKGHDTRALQAYRPPQHPAHGAIHRVVAGQVQGLLALTDMAGPDTGSTRSRMTGADIS